MRDQIHSDYDKFRPKYPVELIERACKLANLPDEADLLEIGAGPATATVSFAKRGYHITSIEPNEDLYEMAEKKCRSFPNVEFANTTFEEWSLRENAFDAVFAPLSIHLVSPEVAYRKSAKALRENGYMMLFWNMPLRPSVEVHKKLKPIYEEICPSLDDKYKDNNILRNQIDKLGKDLKNSTFFGDMQYSEAKATFTYSGSEYVRYLNTSSNYFTLEESKKAALFDALKKKIREDFQDQIVLHGLTALQIAKKRRGR